MGGFVNVDSLVNNTFKSATKKLISSLDSVVGATDAIKPKYIYPKDIDNLSTANYMIIYVYDCNKNDSVFAPINTQIAKSKIQQNLAKRLTDCVSVKIGDKAKEQLKQYKNAVNSWLQDSLKDIFNKDALSKLGSALGIDIDTPEWLKETGDFLRNNQLTRGIKDLVSNIDMPNLPGLEGLDLSDYVEVDIDGQAIQGILKKELLSITNRLNLIQTYDQAMDLESEAGKNFNLVTSIVLPLPQNDISYSYKMSIDSAETKTAQAVKSVVDGIKSGYNEAKKNDKAKSTIGGFLEDMGNVYGAAKAGIKKTAEVISAQSSELAYGLLGSGGKVLFQNETSKVRDPLIEFAWSIPDPRTFTYEYTFAPRDSSELYDVWNIIKTLKFYSHMDMVQSNGSVRYFNFPGRFKIKYYTEGQENIWLGQTKVMGLSEITTTIDGNNIGFILNDFDKISGNPPKIIKMSMTFKELSILNRDDINEGY